MCVSICLYASVLYVHVYNYLSVLYVLYVYHLCHQVTCEMVKCPDPYMGKDQPNAPPNPLKGKQDPYGSTGDSYVEYGMCPR